MRSGGDGVDGKKWKAEYDPKFERQYRSLGREAAKRVNTAIDDMVVAENVRDARECKGRIPVGGTMSHVFARSVGRSYRILYCVRAAACAFCGWAITRRCTARTDKVAPGARMARGRVGPANANAIWAEREGVRSRQPAGSKSRAGGGGEGEGEGAAALSLRLRMRAARAIGSASHESRVGGGNPAAAAGPRPPAAPGSPACTGNSGPKGAGGAARPPPKPPTGAPCGRAP